MPSDHVPHPPPNEARKGEPTYVRFDAELLERVEAHRATLQARAGVHAEVSRAAAIRDLVELGLDTATERAA